VLSIDWADKYTEWLKGKHNNEILPINNSHLIKEDRTLLENCKEDYDYVLVNE
jgi:NifU-like protein involved in Fe-S cluster formation